MLIISAPTIIVSIDSSHDTSILLDLSEEEEKEDVKLLFDFVFENSEEFSLDSSDMVYVGYTNRSYLKPHLNLIFPPPEKQLV